MSARERSRRRDLDVKGRWLAEVLRSPQIFDSVRVLLLVMAEYMTAGGYVTVPRSVLAGRLGRTPRRVTERIEKAKDAGYLQVVRSGRPGCTAAYNAVIPVLSHGADGGTKQGGGRGHQPHGAPTSTHSWRTGAPSKTDTHGAPGGPANARARVDSPSVSEGVAVDNNREQRPDHDGGRAADYSERRDEGETQPASASASSSVSPAEVSGNGQPPSTQGGVRNSTQEGWWPRLGSDFPRCEVCRHLLHEGLVAAGLTVCEPCQAKVYAVGGAT